MLFLLLLLFLWNDVVFVAFVVFAVKETETRHAKDWEEQSVDRPIEPTTDAVIWKMKACV